MKCKLVTLFFYFESPILHSAFKKKHTQLNKIPKPCMIWLLPIPPASNISLSVTHSCSHLNDFSFQKALCFYPLTVFWGVFSPVENTIPYKPLPHTHTLSLSLFFLSPPHSPVVILAITCSAAFTNSLYLWFYTIVCEIFHTPSAYFQAGTKPAQNKCLSNK